jgi:diguanylate cyclase (GGDEF)-like protein
LGLKVAPVRADILYRLNKLTLKKPVHIAVVAPSRPREFFSPLWKGIWSAACELAPFGVRIDSFETDTHDLTAQKRILANLRQNPPAALALVPAHASELDREITLLSALQAPVITFHTDAPYSCRDSHVGADPSQSGSLAGEMLALLMQGCGTVASFPGAMETEHLKLRYLAFRQELKRLAPNIREAVSHYGYDGLEEAAKRALESDQPVGGIYVGCSRSHLVAKSLLNSGKKIPFVGFDLTDLARPFLAGGTISALIDEDVFHQGYLAIHQAYEAIGAHPGERTLSVPIKASILLSASCSQPELVDPAMGGLDNLIRIRTQRSRRYQKLLEEASSQIVTMSETDPLTGLLNRSRFEELLSSRAKEHESLSILMVGLDGFEQTNHCIGQPVGDEALKTVAKVLVSLVRPQDDCARIGGDEFCVLMPGADSSHVAEVRERVLAALAKSVIAPRTLNLGIRVSAGCASLPGEASNAEDLLIRADNSMYVHRRSMLCAQSARAR